MTRFLLVLIGLFSAILLLHAAGQAGGDGPSPWKPLLPADAYSELTKRSVAAIEATAKSGVKDAAERVEAEAAILVGYTLSVKNPTEEAVGKVRGAAIQAVQAARSGDLKKPAGFGKMIEAAPNAAIERMPRKAYLQELAWVMEIFKGKAKGGEGLHAELQYSPPLKKLNGIEAFIGALAKKKLSDDNLAKVSKELPNLAYRLAVVGSITHEFPPAKGAGQWRELSNQMRDASTALAEAAHKKNGAGVLTAATALENSCTQCHSVFKGK
ncbi:MAG: hypothetical protein EXR98_02320 [Gemmataceae bacterium]|nr:hypothetical protein [Gemmataceae bacterium]